MKTLATFVALLGLATGSVQAQVTKGVISLTQVG